MNEENYLTLIVAFCVAAVVSTLQAIETKMKLTTAVINWKLLHKRQPHMKELSDG